MKSQTSMNQFSPLDYCWDQEACEIQTIFDKTFFFLQFGGVS